MFVTFHLFFVNTYAYKITKIKKLYFVYVFQKLLNAFNFLFINVNTMQAYKAEVFAGYSKLLGLNPKGSGYTHTFASLDVVWMSLTNNSRSLLQLITNHYYRKKEPLEFFELFRLAR